MLAEEEDGVTDDPSVCFYCTTRLVDRPNTPRSRTIDHLIPKSDLLGNYRQTTSRQKRLNRVYCCNWCNRRKGRMSPYMWASMLPWPQRRAVFERLEEYKMAKLTKQRKRIITELQKDAAQVSQTARECRDNPYLTGVLLEYEALAYRLYYAARFMMMN